MYLCTFYSVHSVSCYVEKETKLKLKMQSMQPAKYFPIRSMQFDDTKKTEFSDQNPGSGHPSKKDKNTGFRGFYAFFGVHTDFRGFYNFTSLLPRKSGFIFHFYKESIEGT